MTLLYTPGALMDSPHPPVLVPDDELGLVGVQYHRVHRHVLPRLVRLVVVRRGRRRRRRRGAAVVVGIGIWMNGRVRMSNVHRPRRTGPHVMYLLLLLFLLLLVVAAAEPLAAGGCGEAVLS